MGMERTRGAVRQGWFYNRVQQVADRGLLISDHDRNPPGPSDHILARSHAWSDEAVCARLACSRPRSAIVLTGEAIAPGQPGQGSSASGS